LLQIYYVSAKNYENRLTRVKVTNEDKVGPFIETLCMYQVAQKCPTGQSAVLRQQIELFIKITGFIADEISTILENFTKIFSLF